MDKIRTIKGFYNGSEIISEHGEIIQARAYASRDIEWKNKNGFFNLKTEEGFTFEIIFEALIIDEQS